jgi:hypothetical protein
MLAVIYYFSGGKDEYFCEYLKEIKMKENHINQIVNLSPRTKETQ